MLDSRKSIEIAFGFPLSGSRLKKNELMNDQRSIDPVIEALENCFLYNSISLERFVQKGYGDVKKPPKTPNYTPEAVSVVGSSDTPILSSYDRSRVFQAPVSNGRILLDQSSKGCLVEGGCFINSEQANNHAP
jgi:predicted AAA+ superfamily ATPase